MASYKPRVITVTAVCPGWVDTGMLPREKNGRPIRYIGMVKPDVVVKKALRDSRHGKDLSTPGFFAGYLHILLHYRYPLFHNQFCVGNLRVKSEITGKEPWCRQIFSVTAVP